MHRIGTYLCETKLQIVPIVTISQLVTNGKYGTNSLLVTNWYYWTNCLLVTDWYYSTNLPIGESIGTIGQTVYMYWSPIGKTNYTYYKLEMVPIGLIVYWSPIGTIGQTVYWWPMCLLVSLVKNKGYFLQIAPIVPIVTIRTNWRQCVDWWKTVFYRVHVILTNRTNSTNSHDSYQFVVMCRLVLLVEKKS